MKSKQNIRDLILSKKAKKTPAATPSSVAPFTPAINKDKPDAMAILGSARKR